MKDDKVKESDRKAAKRQPKKTETALQTRGKHTKTVKGEADKAPLKPLRKAKNPAEEKAIQTVKNKGGAPSKFVPEVTSKILAAIRAGNYIETAAAWAGIDKTTIYDWLRQGAKQTEGEFREFSNAVGEALAHAEISDLNNIAEAAKKGNWQASAWRLERKNPARWGRKDRTPVAPEDDIDYDNLTDEELDHICATGRLPDKR